jgi:hypothetical protein
MIYPYNRSSYAVVVMSSWVGVIGDSIDKDDVVKINIESWVGMWIDMRRVGRWIDMRRVGRYAGC